MMLHVACTYLSRCDVDLILATLKEGINDRATQVAQATCNQYNSHAAMYAWEPRNESLLQGWVKTRMTNGLKILRALGTW